MARQSLPSRAPPSATGHRSGGFTLIEMLVVLIIVAMSSSVLYQALERAFRLQQRFGTELLREQEGQMAAGWYRQTVQGLYPDFPDGQSRFQGREEEFSGLSSNALGADYGVPTAVTWRLRSDSAKGTTELLYVEAGRETPILTWRARGARFVYIDSAQAAYASWPPPFGVPEQLPSQIHLLGADSADAISLIATPMGPRKSLPRLQSEL